MVLVATLILTFIMLFIVPTFETMFEEFGLTLPAPTLLLIAMSNYIAGYWFLLIAMPICLLILIKLLRKFRHGRMGFDMFIIKVPIFRQPDRKEHSGSYHANAGNAGLQRCADSRGDQHHARDIGQRDVRADVYRRQRFDSRRGSDQQAAA